MSSHVSVKKETNPASERASRTSGFSNKSERSATSFTGLPMPPSVSKELDVEMVPFGEDAPTVSFIANRAARLAGALRDPSVSVPVPRGAKSAGIPTATPVDDPPGFCDGD
jgi:hypothetical protein